jgi:hypothetical protein
MSGAVNGALALFLDAKAEFCNAWSCIRKLVYSFINRTLLAIWSRSKYFRAVNQLYYRIYFKIFIFIPRLPHSPLSPPRLPHYPPTPHLRLCSYAKGGVDKEPGTWRWPHTSTSAQFDIPHLPMFIKPSNNLTFPLPSVPKCY